MVLDGHTWRMTKSRRRKRYPLLLSDDERAQLQAAADADHRTLADWIRVTCVVAAAKKAKC